MYQRTFYPPAYFSPAYWPMGFTIIVSNIPRGIFNTPLFEEIVVGLF